MRSNKWKQSIWTLLMIVSVCVFVFAVYRLVSRYRIYYAADVEYESLSEIAHQTEAVENPAEEDQGAIDFTALAAINAEVIGWVVIEGTNINYPVVQSSDNDAYLHTTFRGESNPSGTIFLDYRNNPDFTDKNSVIYGHNMKNKSMFNGLFKYKGQTFYEEHPTFVIYTPDAEHRCEVIAAYVTSAVSEAYALTFKNDAVFLDFLNTAVSNSVIQTDAAISVTDRIVTLSTCDYSYDDARMVVHARIID